MQSNRRSAGGDHAGTRVRRNLPLTKPGRVVITDAEIREKRLGKYSDIIIGNKVLVARPTKAKGDTNYFHDSLTVIVKKHGTLELLLQYASVVKRTVPFVKQKIERNAELEKLEQASVNPQAAEK